MNESPIIRWLNQNIRSHLIRLLFIICICTLLFINMTFQYMRNLVEKTEPEPIRVFAAYS